MQLKHVSQTDGKIQGAAHNLISAAVCEIHAGLSGWEEAHCGSTQPCTTASDDSKLSFPKSQNLRLVRNQKSCTRAIAQLYWEKPGTTLLPSPARSALPTDNCPLLQNFLRQMSLHCPQWWKKHKDINSTALKWQNPSNSNTGEHECY